MGTDQTITQPTAAISILLVVLLFALPRKYFLTPLIAAACFLPCDQHLFLLGGHFYVQRILILSAIVRIVVRDENRLVKWNRLDKILFMWAFCGTLIYIARRPYGASVVNRLGYLVDVVGLYWVVRKNVASWESLKVVWHVFAVCALVMVPLVAIEWKTQYNVFSTLGERAETLTRLDDIRCTASFPHPIIAGAFWAPIVPFLIALAYTGRRSLFYWVAVAAAIFIVMATNSSTPIGGLAAVLGFAAAYRWRHYGRLMAYSFFGTLVFLHFVRQAPVWHLLCRIKIIGGSTGWHRYLLIDETINHFREWAILGTVSTAHWGRGLFDITNQYVLEGVRGGALTLVLFIAILYTGIRASGGYSQKRIGRDRQWLSWALCCSLIGHSVMFIGVSYFGQVQMLLYLTFAMAGTVYEYNAAYRPASVQRVRARPRHVRSGAPAVTAT